MALFRLTMTSRHVVLEQYELWFSQFYNLRYEQGPKMSKARIRKTDQDIMNHSVLNSLALTQGCSSLLTENGLHPLHYSWMNSICDVAAIRQHR